MIGKVQKISELACVADDRKLLLFSAHPQHEVAKVHCVLCWCLLHIGTLRWADVKGVGYRFICEIFRLKSDWILRQFEKVFPCQRTISRKTSLKQCSKYAIKSNTKWNFFTRIHKWRSVYIKETLQYSHQKSSECKTITVNLKQLTWKHIQNIC